MKLLNRITNLRNPLKPLLVLCGVMWRYFQDKKLKYKRKHCKHEKGAWLDDHCGVSYHECKKCGELLMYL